VFLTSLTMRGFKSFADKTVLDVEPGITVIVGPNGSGKSNVVDGLAWVLGTHSAKKVRGGSMSDVIFAGSPTRSALGQAKVEITIDNSQGQLGEAALGTSGSAQQFSEVRVSRTIYASGENIYEINGEDVRALDVQELLSDTGLGKELHTIVGQGQLDEILNAKPEERRKFIEEAAGILKHRRRRERALRKLDQVDAHIDKLKSVLRELRRQLRPLERQAEAANAYTQLQSELREARIQIAAIDLDRLSRLWQQDSTDDAEAAQRQTDAEAAVERVRAREADIETRLREQGPAADRAQNTYYRLSSLLERLKGAQDLVEAKRKHLVEYVEEPLAGRPPAELRAQAERIDGDRRERQLERNSYKQLLDDAVAARREAEGERRAHEQRLQAEARRRAQAREQVLRWEGEVSALRGSVASGEAEVGRVASQLTSLDERVAEAEHEVEKVQEEIQRLDAAEVGLTSALETTEARVDEAAAAVDALVARETELERERSSQAARAEALRAALSETDGGTAALLAADLDGVLGPVADHVRVDTEADAAIAAALGPLGEAVVVSSPDTARRAVAWLRTSEVGSALILPVGSHAAASPTLSEDTREQLATAGARPVADVLHAADGAASGEVVDSLRQALARTYLVEAWDHAVLLHGRNPDLTFVTAHGDIAGPQGYLGGEAPARSAVATATAADEAERRAVGLADQLATVREQLVAARDELAACKRDLDESTGRINESDAQITGAAERLARLNKELHALANQRQIVAANHHELTEVLERDRTGLSELNSRGPQVEVDEVDDGPDEEAHRLDEAVEAARERELDARVRLERMTENLRHLELQADELRREADEVERALAAAARRRELRREGIARCGELAAFARQAIDQLETSTASARTGRDDLQAGMRTARQELDETREHLGELTAELDRVKEARHAADLRRSDLKHQLDQLVERLRTEFSLSPDEVRAEHPEVAGYDRAALSEDEDVLVRKLGLLGRVNPLALEEFKALEERHTFLSDQLDDLRRSKRDLQDVVVAVDDRIRAVFAEAYEDVAREFEQTFTTVFPGGTGRLVLTDPDDMLTTGIEVEARPPGKKVKRLSLLSGGERSLTVLAFVFAIFRARPSPFYVLDEVDAALDDVNLQRLLRVIRSFRGHSQIIMVTHQKRSMEIADVMYGITMGPDAVTKVVAERFDGATAPEARMGEPEAAPATV
jgi:chromosome segregation protein